MRIAIGNDHRGVDFKMKLAELLSRLGHQTIDQGSCDAESVDYPDIALDVAQSVASHRADRGILVCGTGIGMAITANKIAGIRAATCHDNHTAEMCRRHNDVNVLCLSGQLDAETTERIVQIWLETEFEGGRHQRRLDKIAALENQPTGSH